MAGDAFSKCAEVGALMEYTSLIKPGTIIYWECSDFFDMDYNPSILLHDSDGCEYTQGGKKVSPGIVLNELRIEMRGPMCYDVLCSDGVIRRIDSGSMWPVEKN